MTSRIFLRFHGFTLVKRAPPPSGKFSSTALVRHKISNLKPSSIGYKTAWERLKKEYDQTNLVVNAHIDEVVNLPKVRGSSYEKILAYYERLSKNYDALQTLGEHEKLDGFVMCTINTLPNVKSDLVRTDEDERNAKWRT
jgi:seryl-tRNA synthetase